MSETESIPFDIEGHIGEVKAAEQLCPGVYYITALDSEIGLPREYYAVNKSEAPLSPQAKAYGQELEGDDRILMFPLDDERGGGKVIEYEVQKYLKSHDLSLPDGEDALSTAFFGMEFYPEYFGDYPVPTITPRGVTMRHKRLACGVYALETERFERMIAVCYPVWSVDLSEYTVAQAEQLEYDKERGIDNTLGYLFFPESVGCLVLFELWKWYDEIMATGMVDRAAMMNAIYVNHPEYAVTYNRREQEGLNDSAAHFWRWLGYDVEPEGKESNLIVLDPETGTAYLTF